tara:strand:- start:231 stop:434 length:204 start_codon:yes stop_codon:yes gene_type:complete
MANYTVGDTVKWNWGNGTGTGTVETIYEKKITRTLQGSEVTRNGSEDDPALYIVGKGIARAHRTHIR